MKSLNIFTIIFSLALLFNLSADDSNFSIKSDFVEESTLKDINFDEVTKDLSLRSRCLIDRSEKEGSTLSSTRGVYSNIIVTPISQDLIFLNNVLCHIGNYSYFSIITPLEGLHYGIQVAVDYNNIVISVNDNFIAEYSRNGVTFKHYYPDCKIITGQNQILIY